MGLPVTIVTCSEKGGRDYQLDKAFSLSISEINLLVVLDGVGDQKHNFIEEFETNIKLNFEVAFADSPDNIDVQLRELIEKSAKDCDSEGTVCAVFSLVTHDSLVIAHCGDCRAYLPDRQFSTKDHSLAIDLHTDTFNNHQHIAKHPLRNLITKTISKTTQLFDVLELPALSNSERLILCSDGWWRNIESDNIHGLTEERINGTVTSALEDPIVDNDNVTVMLFIHD